MTPRQLTSESDKQLRERMKEANPTSANWSGLVAELQWRAADKMIRQTRAVIWLTWVLAILTAILLFYTIKFDQRSSETVERGAFQQDDAAAKVPVPRHTQP